jgi:chromosome segregation protein
MFLQKIDIQGFKSFVDKTTVEFGDGLTGVVGPNGCGKTNVSDAIRWVLGEQSAKQLRGDSMEDVIFNGAPTRKPVGMAEVHITFRNDRGILPTEFSEITVSRKVFRSGVSEYLLNGAACRLKDIRDLFSDTGMGSHAYSVIERQMVDHVLSDNSGHRRFLFEEASGITKYKARKKEALAKLEATEGDLTRVNDIVFELERELRSLARQVGKARRFQRLRDSIRDLDLTLTSGRVIELKRGEAEAAERWQEEATRREGATAELAGVEARLNDEKLALLELEREMSTAQSGLKDREETRVQAEHQIVLLEERAAGLAARGEEAGAEATRMRERRDEAAQQEQEAVERRADVRQQAETARGELATREAALAECETELRQHRSVATEQKQLSLDLFSSEAEKRGAAERILERLSVLAERHAALALRHDEAVRRAAERDQVLAAANQRRTGVDAELDEARATLARLVGRVEQLDGSLQDSDAGIAEARQQIAAAESRLAVLLELKRNFEGVSDGVKSLFHDSDRVEGLVGVIADVLEIPATDLDAIEAALGEAAAFVLVDSATALERAVERLRALGTGRATLIDVTAAQDRALPALPQEPGVRSRASDAVRCAPAYRTLVERLLGNVVLVDDAATAAALASRHEGLRFVSPEGEVWDKGRVRAGASSAGGLLHREMEIRELNGQLAERSLGLEARVREREALASQRLAAIAERELAAGEVDVRRTKADAVLREIEAAAHEKTWAETEAEEKRQEIETLVAETGALERSRAQAEDELRMFMEEVERARAQLSDLDAVVHAAEVRREEASATLQALRDRLFALAREEMEWESRWARAEQTRRELESGIEARGGEERQCAASRAEIAAQVSGLQSGLGGLRDSEAVQRERVTELQSRFAAARDAAAASEEDARRRRFELTELSELLHQLELDRVQRRAELDRTYERLATEYELDVAAWTPAEPPAEFDAAAAETELEASRQRLRTLGNVTCSRSRSTKRRRSAGSSSRGSART